MTKTQQMRCAIYTRKSSEEGLEQSFNSLQAQREACEAYIKSQKHEGWHALNAHYDDGGFSGGSMQRPALQKLLDDIAAGRVNVVVVYKVDRLTRSLSDFSKIIESFDQQNVSFVSVTQQFNTTTSMGRLTLNVLLSFAQFEREVTGERIRDKIAASKKKGMWMGGTVPLGYDTRDHQLFVNSGEAEVVRTIFSQYVRLGCVSQLKRYLDDRGIVSKLRKSEQRSGGSSFSRGALYQILNNEIYIGRIPHKTQSYPGKHEPIVSNDLWEKVASLLRSNDRGKRSRGRRPGSRLLAGILFDEHGNRYTPTHAVKGGKRYRYYTSQALIRLKDHRPTRGRIPAAEIEAVVEHRFVEFLQSPEGLAKSLADAEPEQDSGPITASGVRFADGWKDLTRDKRADCLQGAIRRIVVRTKNLEITIDLRRLINLITGPAVVQASNSESIMLLKAALDYPEHIHGFRLVQVPGDSATPSENRALIKAIARAHSWVGQIVAGQICSKEQLAKQTKLNPSYAGRILRLAALSPEVVERIINGQQKVDGRFEMATKNLPTSWKQQARNYR